MGKNRVRTSQTVASPRGTLPAPSPQGRHRRIAVQGQPGRDKYETLPEKQLKQKGLGVWLKQYSPCLASTGSEFKPQYHKTNNESEKKPQRI
jgi:hypothetical protein